MSKHLTAENIIISVVIPCYNEAETLKTVLESVRDCGLKTQIIVVDDGSTDGSRELLAGELKPYVDKILFHKSNLLNRLRVWRYYTAGLAKNKGILAYLQAEAALFVKNYLISIRKAPRHRGVFRHSSHAPPGERRRSAPHIFPRRNIRSSQ